MQAAYLISDKDFTEKQVGLIFLVFGLSQFLCMAPAGYYLDYSNHKIDWVIYSSILISAITVFGTLTAEEGGENMALLLFWRVIQGGLTAMLPPGFNSITLGIVGTKGFTHQVSRNRMMNHMGTALVIAAGSLIAYFYYPELGYLFSVSPMAAAGVWYYLAKIKPDHVHRDAARGLILESPTMEEYELADDLASAKKEAANILQWESNQSSDSDWSSAKEYSPQNADYESPPNVSSYRPPELADGINPPSSDNQNQHPGPPMVSPALVDRRSSQRILNIQQVTSSERIHRTTMNENHSGSSGPSYDIGWPEKEDNNGYSSRPRTPWAVLINPQLLIFTVILFLFHLANSSVLPLVMQSLAVQDAQAGILLSGLCILIAQGFMAFFAKICGDYSPYWGRKNLILVGLLSLSFRCFLLSGLESAKDTVDTENGNRILRILVLSTQFLDSVGAGILGTMQILVTNDISGGTGRFSLLLGVTTGATCLGATISGYLGQALAQDFGYAYAFTVLGAISLTPFALYALFMPETLPEDARPRQQRKRRSLRELIQRFHEHKRKLFEVSTKPFRRKSSKSTSAVDPTPIAGELV